MTRANLSRSFLAFASLSFVVSAFSRGASAKPPVADNKDPARAPASNVAAPASQPAAEPGFTAAEPTATAPAPVSSQQPVPLSQSQECFPPCRAGYFCYAGRCVSPCNPPCETGTICTAEGACLVQVNPSLQTPDAAVLREAALKERLAYRMKPRFTVHGLVTMGPLAEGGALLIGFTGTLGYRQNLAEQMGIQVRGGITLGGTMAANSSQNSSVSGSSSSSTTYSDDTAFTTVVFGEAGPVFGPFGRFYMGPIVWGGQFMFSRNSVVAHNSYGDVREVVLLPDLWKWGGGIDMGILALRHEQLDINWRLKSCFNQQLPVLFEVGVGFHAM